MLIESWQSTDTCRTANREISKILWSINFFCNIGHSEKENRKIRVKQASQKIEIWKNKNCKNNNNIIYLFVYVLFKTFIVWDAGWSNIQGNIVTDYLYTHNDEGVNPCEGAWVKMGKKENSWIILA